MNRSTVQFLSRRHSSSCWVLVPKADVEQAVESIVAGAQPLRSPVRGESGAQRMCILALREAGAQALRTPATSWALGGSLGKVAKTTEIPVLPLLDPFGRFPVELGGKSFADAMAVYSPSRS